jgi:probable rRNA maturation factor
MAVVVEMQLASEADEVPPDSSFQRWAEAALEGRQADAELVVRVVDEAESQQLNREYRGKDRPTNVLSFPFEAPPGVPSDHIGDLVICAPVVQREAREQGKRAEAHWAHMTVHGVLHLLGYDHIDDDQAEQMEGLERDILATLNFPDPYETETDA